MQEAFLSIVFCLAGSLILTASKRRGQLGGAPYSGISVGSVSKETEAGKFYKQGNYPVDPLVGRQTYEQLREVN